MSAPARPDPEESKAVRAGAVLLIKESLEPDNYTLSAMAMRNLIEDAERWQAFAEAETARADAAEARADAAKWIAKQAINGWACFAKREDEHEDISRLHRELAQIGEGKL